MSTKALVSNMTRIAEGYDPESGPPLPVGIIDGWAVSTDGHCLVAVLGGLDLAPYPTDALPDVAKIATYVGPLIADWPHEASVILQELREWAGPSRVAREDCTRCDGTGKGGNCAGCSGRGKKPCQCPSCYDEHEATCDKCDGVGYGPCVACGLQLVDPREPVAVLGVAFNRHLLANALRFLPGEIAFLARHPEGKAFSDPVAGAFALWVCGNGWRVAIMPLHYTAEEAAALPTFQLRTIGGPA